MAFMIRSSDGRLRICTYGALAALGHVERLRGLGLRVNVTDFNGNAYKLGALHRRAAAASGNV